MRGGPALGKICLEPWRTITSAWFVFRGFCFAYRPLSVKHKSHGGHEGPFSRVGISRMAAVILWKKGIFFKGIKLSVPAMVNKNIWLIIAAMYKKKNKPKTHTLGNTDIEYFDPRMKYSLLIYVACPLLPSGVIGRVLEGTPASGYVPVQVTSSSQDPLSIWGSSVFPRVLWQCSECILVPRERKPTN